MLGVTLSVAIVIIGGCQQFDDLRWPNFAPTRPHLSVVTYNVNFGLAQPDNVTQFLTESEAAVICLQETHPRWERVLRAALETEYPHCVFQEWQEAGGMAVMSKYELSRVRVVEPQSGWWPGLLVEIEAPIGTVQVLNVHLKPPLSERGCVTLRACLEAVGIHCRELSEFLEHVDPDRPLIVAGDFNESEIGVALRSLLSRGFTSALSIFDVRSKTWYWKTALGIIFNDRYDHILYNDCLDCTGAEVAHAPGSDHMPVRAVMVQKEPLVAFRGSAQP